MNSFWKTSFGSARPDGETPDDPPKKQATAEQALRLKEAFREVPESELQSLVLPPKKRRYPLA